jgi:hypothetical protein
MGEIVPRPDKDANRLRVRLCLNTSYAIPIPYPGKRPAT